MVATLMERQAVNHYEPSPERHRPSFNQPTATPKKTFLCPKCTEQNSPDCSHCFMCGESGHRAVGCLKRPKIQGNGKRPLSKQSETDIALKSQLIKPVSKPPATQHSSKQTRKQPKHDQRKHCASSCQTSTECKVPLVGRKCQLKCLIGGYPVTVLFNSGSQVSIVDRQWVKIYMPNYQVRPLQELLDDELEVYAVNGPAVPYDKWVKLTVTFAGHEDPNLCPSPIPSQQTVTPPTITRS